MFYLPIYSIALVYSSGFVPGWWVIIPFFALLLPYFWIRKLFVQRIDYRVGKRLAIGTFAVAVIFGLIDIF